GELVQRVRDTSTEAFDHAQVGFDELVSAVNPTRDVGRNPLFGVLVEYERVTGIDFDPPRLQATLTDVPSDRAPLDLTWYLSHHENRVDFALEYDTDLFDEPTVRRLLEYVEALLRRAVADQAQRLAALTAPIDRDRAALSEWAGSVTNGQTGCLHDLFERQAAATPDAVALRYGDRDVSYAELDRLGNQLAWRLHERGVRPDDIVAICLPRGIDQIAAVLGVLKAGAAYLPLDTALPESRMAYLVSDSGAGTLIGDDDALAKRLRVPLMPPVEPAPDSPAATTATPAGSAPDSRAATPPPRTTGLDNLAYCIYTSGSTGNPKGVAVPHRGPANLITWYLANRPTLRTMQWVSIGFDISVQEIFTALASGATLVLIGEQERYEPASVAQTVRRHGVERLIMTYTALRSLMDGDPEMPSLRELISVGEPLELTPRIRRFLARHPDCGLFNEYGPTEASIIVTSHTVDPDAADRPPIGRPIANVVARVLDERRRPVPVGVVGELCLGGACLAREYVGLPGQTDAAFIPDPEAPGGFLYRTGDLARWLPGGVLEHLGRIDDQVKIRGNRVEPGETERVLRGLPDVPDAAVVAGTDPHGDTCLIGYVVADEPAVIGELPDRLAGTLPSYLIPTAWVELAELPVNASGKLDRTRLPAPDWGTTGAGSAPESPLERRLHDLWAAQLDVTEVPVDRSFFQLGGHSLSAVELVNRVREALRVEFRVADLFRSPTIRAMARHLTPRAAGDDVAETAPVTSLQRRGWELHHRTGHPEVYNVGHRITVQGQLDPDALERAFDAVVRRHAALRTRIVDRDGTPRQETFATVPVRVAVVDLSEIADDPDAVAAWCQSQASQAIAPDDVPLWRLRLGRLGDDRWELVVVLHHLICDGWSMGLLWTDLSTCYTDAVAGRDAELPAATSFLEYARWLSETATGRHEELERHWRTALADAPVRLDLPYDRPRPEWLSGAGALHQFRLPDDICRGVRETAESLAATVAGVLTGGFAVWMAQLCGQRDLVFGASSANRLTPEHRGVVGPVGEPLLLRLQLSDAIRFDHLVNQVGENLAVCLDHQPIGFAGALDAARPGSGTGAVTPQVLFTVVTTPPAMLELPGASATVRSLPAGGVARTELYLVLMPREGSIDVVIEYSTDLFDAATVRGWEKQITGVLAEVTTDPRRTV
ncbi:MAG: amino acid adenylation domain-containing protein, partial [Micromonosporaceae bacterium]